MGEEGSKDVSMDDERQKHGSGQSNEEDLQVEIVTRLRQQLALLREQVRRMHDALHRTEDLRASARDRLDSLRATSEKLEQALRMEEAARGGGPHEDLSDHDSISDKLNWQPLAGDDRTPIQRQITVQLTERHVHALMVSGLLSIGDMNDSAKVGDILQNLLDRWSEHYMEDKSRGPNAGSEQRRSSHDRRGKQPRANSLLSYVYQTTLDRRSQAERRQITSASLFSEAESDTRSSRTEPNVIRLEDVRALMIERRKSHQDVVKKIDEQQRDNGVQTKPPSEQPKSEAADTDVSNGNSSGPKTKDH